MYENYPSDCEIIHKICENLLQFFLKYSIIRLGYKILRFQLYNKSKSNVLGGSRMEVLKVSSRSVPNSVAGAIAGVIRENKNVEIQAVGAGAANQAVKSIAVARGYLAPIGIDLICIPAFTSIQIDGEDRTAIKLICEPR